MDFKNILENIVDLTEEDIEKENDVKIEDLEKIHPSLDLNHSMTYKLYYAVKKDELPEEDKEILLKIIEKLERNENLYFKKTIEKMIDFQPIDYSKNKIIYDA